MRKFLKIFTVMAALLMFATLPALAQTRDVARQPLPSLLAESDFVLEKIGLDVVIDGQKARCTLKYVIHNPGNGDIEVDFLAPLPQGGTITGLTLFDGKQEMSGNVYNKNEAWQIYREIVASLKDPALLEYAGRDTFRVRIFPVPANGRQTLELNFDYLVPKNDGQTGFSFPLAGPMTINRKPVQDIHIVVKDKPGLSGLYTPSAQADIKHEAGQDAVIKYRSENTPVLDKFQLYFQTGAGSLGGLILSHKPEKDDDGFFLFLADPALDPKAQVDAAKNVIFVLDKSGSMIGTKFAQATDALRFILEHMNEQDNFNLVDYNDNIFSWQPELMAMTPENRKAALAYVDNLRANGSTHIEGALKEAFHMISNPEAPNYVIFLTDGQATAGETNEMKLADIAAKANPNNGARLFSFGVGYDVNARLLDRLSGQAGGTTVFVNPDENLEAKVSSFFARITTPALTRPQLKGSLALNRVMPRELPDLFIGQQLVVVGRYPKGGETSFTLTGRQNGKDQNFTYKVKLADGPTSDGAFITSIWAQRRIGEIIDELDLKGHNQELVDELVQLSKKYGILTPYTSFLALENQPLTEQEELSRMADSNIVIMQESAGKDANYQRSVKAEMKASTAPAPKANQESFAEMVTLDKHVSSSDSFNKVHAPNQWANQTFFYKNGQWQAENLVEEDLAKIITIKQLSDEYYELAKKLQPEEIVWLTQKEPVVFNHSGLTYLIEPITAN